MGGLECWEESFSFISEAMEKYCRFLESARMEVSVSGKSGGKAFIRECCSETDQDLEHGNEEEGKQSQDIRKRR